MAEPGEEHRVVGKVLEMDDQGLKKPDEFVGAHSVCGYGRTVIPATSAKEISNCNYWTCVKDRSTIDGIRSEPMEEFASYPR